MIYDPNLSPEENLRLYDEVITRDKERSRNLSSYLSELKKDLEIKKNIGKIESQILFYEDALNKKKINGKALTEEQLNLLKQRVDSMKESVNYAKNLVSQTNYFNTALKAGYSQLEKGLATIPGYLNQVDGTTKQLNLSLGITGEKARIITKNITDAATSTAQLNGTVESLSKIYNSYTENTGRANILNEKQLSTINEIRVGLGLSEQEAGKLVSQMTEMGVSVAGANKFLEETVNKSAKLGLNGQQTIKIVEQNLKKANTYNFQGGLKAFGEMVQYTQRMKLNVDSMFATMDKFSTLEGAIDASANLQVLGGEFAKLADPMTMGFLARNNPEEFTKQIGNMTKGLAVFNKETGQFQISAYNMDRLRKVAEITGQEVSTLVESSQQMSKMQAIGSKLIGLSPEDKELVTNMAEFKDGKWVVDFGEGPKEINKIQSQQLQNYRAVEKTLAERAKEAQTFDKVWVNTVNQFKAAFLPLLPKLTTAIEIFRSILESTVIPALDMLKSVNEKFGGFTTALIAIASAGGLFGGIVLVKTLIGALTGFTKKGITNVVSNVIPGAGGGLGGGTSVANAQSTGQMAQSLKAIPDAATLTAKAKGIAAIGVAALGIGAGIGLATMGISKMVEAFKGLSDKQMSAALQSIALVMGSFTIGILALSQASVASAPGLAALSLSFVGIGAGIGLATLGISKMLDSFSGLKNLNVTGIGRDIGEIGSSLALLAISDSSDGVKILQKIGKLDFSPMNNAFKGVNDFIKSDTKKLKELRDTITAIKEFKGNNELSNLIKEFKGIISKPLEVKFANKDIAIRTDVTLMLDKDVLVRKLNIGKNAVIEYKNIKRGLNG